MSSGFQGNAFQGGVFQADSNEQAFTADAMVRAPRIRTLSASAGIGYLRFTADAFIPDPLIGPVVSPGYGRPGYLRLGYGEEGPDRSRPTGFFVADARVGHWGTFTADANVRYLGLLTASAWVIPPLGFFTLDANVLAFPTGSFVGGSTIYVTHHSAFVADSRTAGGLTADARLGRFWISGDAVIHTGTNARAAQVVSETVFRPSHPKARVAQVVAERVFLPDARQARIAQVTVEVIWAFLPQGFFDLDADIWSVISVETTTDAIVLAEMSQTVNGDAISLQPNASSLSADAEIRFGFTANAVLYQPHVMADAVIFGGVSHTYHADAIRRRTMWFGPDGPGVTLDAYLVWLIVGVSTADSVIGGEISRSTRADAVLLRSATGLATADAITQRTKGDTCTADAVLQAVQWSSFAADAVLYGVSQSQVIAVAVVQKITQGSVTADGFAQVVVQGQLDTAAVLQAVHASSLATDADVLTSTTTTVTAGAILRKQYSVSVVFDARIFIPVYEASFDASAVLHGTQTYTFSTMGWVAGLGFAAVSADADIKAWQTGSANAEAVILRGETLQITASASIQGGRSSSFSASAIVLRPGSRSFVADGLVRQTGTGALLASAQFVQRRSGTLTSDASIRSTGAAVFTAAAVLRRSQSYSISASARNRTTTSGSFTGAAVVKAAHSATLSLDAIFRASHTGTLSTRAGLKRTSTATATADAVARASRTSGFLSLAVILSPFAHSIGARSWIGPFVDSDIDVSFDIDEFSADVTADELTSTLDIDEFSDALDLDMFSAVIEVGEIDSVLSLSPPKSSVAYGMFSAAARIEEV